MYAQGDLSVARTPMELYRRESVSLHTAFGGLVAKDLTIVTQGVNGDAFSINASRILVNGPLPSVLR